ncbi:MAG: hypothetical protein B6U95_01340 [Thermofilum sp. ex4484_82]|nr:MAG: hypothetical protein B6U95_01340 [Thermofilum sp. ex4484_82]OYT39737.1 MAG: hypothetical protein B6U96_01345 [Archaeoglobales archaeon ex4484_92]
MSLAIYKTNEKNSFLIFGYIIFIFSFTKLLFTSLTIVGSVIFVYGYLNFRLKIYLAKPKIIK